MAVVRAVAAVCCINDEPASRASNPIRARGQGIIVDVVVREKRWFYFAAATQFTTKMASTDNDPFYLRYIPLLPFIPEMIKLILF